MLEKWTKQYKIVLEKWTNAEKYCWNNVYNQAFYKSFRGDILFEQYFALKCILWNNDFLSTKYVT